MRVRNFHSPAARFEDYIEHIFTLTHARGIKGAKDPRVPVYLAMLMLEYPETLAPGRLRERLPIKALAGLGACFGSIRGSDAEARHWQIGTPHTGRLWHAIPIA